VKQPNNLDCIGLEYTNNQIIGISEYIEYVNEKFKDIIIEDYYAILSNTDPKYSTTSSM
jgi:hypothetical protein